MKKALFITLVAVLALGMSMAMYDVITLHVRNSITNDGTLVQTGAATFNSTVTLNGTNTFAGASTFSGSGTFLGKTVLDTATLQVAVYVSNDTITIPAAGTFFFIDDTIDQAITHISVGSGGANGRFIILFAEDSVGYLDSLVSGGNLKLTADFDGDFGDFIALMQFDSTWYELFRSLE